MAKTTQDTIEFTLTAEETVVNSTVRIEANIDGMIAQDMAEQNLREVIRTIMRRFIETDWQFSNMLRSSHKSGMEQVSLTATARVPESENYALDRRREEAARDHDWVKITAAQANTSPTAAQIAETQSKLRVTLVKKAQEECTVLSKATGDHYRLGSVLYGPVFDSTSNIRASSMGVTAGSAKTSYGSGFDTDDDSIGNAVKLTMQATIQLRISRS